MGTDDLLATIDALAWGEYEVQRMTPTEENQPKSSEKSQVRKVESSPNPQSPKESSGKGAWSKGPPSMGGGRGRESRARSTTPTPEVCYTCLRDGRPANHLYSECSHYLQNQGKGGKKRDSSVHSPRYPFRIPHWRRDPNVCLTCKTQGKPYAHFFRECPMWQNEFDRRYPLREAPKSSPQPSAPPQEPKPAAVPRKGKGKGQHQPNNTPQSPPQAS